MWRCPVGTRRMLILPLCLVYGGKAATANILPGLKNYFQWVGELFTVLLISKDICMKMTCFSFLVTLWLWHHHHLSPDSGRVAKTGHFLLTLNRDPYLNNKNNVISSMAVFPVQFLPRSFLSPAWWLPATDSLKNRVHTITISTATNCSVRYTGWWVPSNRKRVIRPNKWLSNIDTGSDSDLTPAYTGVTDELLLIYSDVSEIKIKSIVLMQMNQIIKIGTDKNIG